MIEIEYHEYDCGIPCTTDGCIGHETDIPESLVIEGFVFQIIDMPTGKHELECLKKSVKLAVSQMSLLDELDRLMYIRMDKWLKFKNHPEEYNHGDDLKYFKGYYEGKINELHNIREVVTSMRKCKGVPEWAIPAAEPEKDCDWTWQDFRDGKVRIDFRGYNQGELKHLRSLCDLVNPGRTTPAYTFGHCYYCQNARWYEGAGHNFAGHKTCRSTEITLETITENVSVKGKL